MICLKCDHKRPIASNHADTASQPVNNNIQNYQRRPWFGQENHSRFEGGDPLRFIESENEDQFCSSSSNHVSDFLDFPVAEGKSDLSQNLQKQESWKMEMSDKSRTMRHDTSKYNSHVFERTSKTLAFDDDDDDDDEMAEWFEGRKKSV